MHQTRGPRCVPPSHPRLPAETRFAVQGLFCHSAVLCSLFEPRSCLPWLSPGFLCPCAFDFALVVAQTFVRKQGKGRICGGTSCSHFEVERRLCVCERLSAWGGIIALQHAARRQHPIHRDHHISPLLLLLLLSQLRAFVLVFHSLYLSFLNIHTGIRCGHALHSLPRPTCSIL